MNYYDVLGVPQSASQDEIRNAYMAQIKFFHPDVFPGDPSIAKVKTLQLNVAYSVLRDSGRRAEYDRRFSATETPPPSCSSASGSDHANQSKKFRRSMVMLSAACILVIVFAFSYVNSSYEDGYNAGYSDMQSNIQDARAESYEAGYNDGIKEASGGKLVDIGTGEIVSSSSSGKESSAPVLVPSTGQILYSDGRECVAPFSVVTRGSNDYYVKLKDAFDSQDVITFFVHGGETAEIDVPLGTYTLYYATGDSWHGVEDLFGESTRYCKADDLFDFYESDGYVNGWTVELYMQSNGNLSTKSIDPSEF